MLLLVAIQLQAQWDPVLGEQHSDRARHQDITLFTLWTPPTIPTTQKQCSPKHTHPHTHFFFHEKWAYTQNAHNQPNKTNRTIPIFTKPFFFNYPLNMTEKQDTYAGPWGGSAVKSTYCSIMKTRILIPWHTSNMSQCL